LSRPAVSMRGLRILLFEDPIGPALESGAKITNQ
jgi:hypothetical protein